MRDIIYDDPRYSQVPWISTSADLRAVGAPEAQVDMWDERTDGLRIVAPFGQQSDAMIQIRAKKGDGNDGGTITLAITTTIIRDTHTMDVAGVPHQSNPRRHIDDGA